MLKQTQLAALIIVSLVAGSFGGYAVGRQTATSAAREQGMEQGKKEAQTAINDRFVAQGMSSKLDAPMKDVYGFVKAVDAEGFTLEYDSAQFSIVETGMKTETVHVGTDAKVQRMISATDAVSAAQAAPSAPGSQADDEIKRLVESGKSGGSGGGVLFASSTTKDGAPPTVAAHQTKIATDPQLKDASLSDLKVGDYVHVVAKEDIRGGSDITAAELTMYDKSFLPADVADPRKLPFGRGGGVLLEPPTPYFPTPTSSPAK